MSLDTTAIIESITSELGRTHLFEWVQTHEPKSSPPNGIGAAVWAQSIEPIARVSGLAATSVRVVFRIRLYTSFRQEPEDAIDPDLVHACDVLLNAFTGNFTLDGNVQWVDLEGSFGIGLSANAAYLNMSGTNYRIIDISLPLVFADVWSQSP